MQVQAINNNTNFGTCRGIVCLEQFAPKTVLEHAQMVDIFCKSPAFTEFGNKYDFIAKFIYCPDFAVKTYKLILAPVNSADLMLTTKNNRENPSQSTYEAEKNNKPQFFNLPIEFTVAACTREFPKGIDCGYDFKRMLQVATFDSINWDLNVALEKHAEELVKIK